MIDENFLLLTDSYKFGHYRMYDDMTKNISAYFESRNGARYPYTVIMGLQAQLKRYFEGVVVTPERINEAEEFVNEHLMGMTPFNRPMWEAVVNKYGGKLPIRIKIAPEGTVVPISNVMVDVETTDNSLQPDGKPLFAPLVSICETILTHLWFSSNVATISYNIKTKFQELAEISMEEKDHWVIDYMLHDFGFRGASCVEAAAMGSLGHLAVFKGTDTPIGIVYAKRYYGCKEFPGHSVNATEHNIMMQRGEAGEIEIIRKLIQDNPKGVISVVGDTYDIRRFVEEYLPLLRDDILNRDGKFVVRPDSPRSPDDTPHAQIKWIVDKLANTFGYTTNNKGFKALNPKVGAIYGDGLSPLDIERSAKYLVWNRWEVSTCVYGMGGGLLQKHNRDTQRSAFKGSSCETEKGWEDRQKNPLDKSKASKAGRMKLVDVDGKLVTRRIEEDGENVMKTVFENGEMKQTYTFDEVRENLTKYK